MEEKEILDKVKELVADRFGKKPDEITEETKFVEDLGADSLDSVEMVMGLDDAFDVKIPDEVAGEITTVGEAVKQTQVALEKKKAEDEAKAKAKAELEANPESTPAANLEAKD